MEQTIVVTLGELLTFVGFILIGVYKILEKRISASEKQLNQMNDKSEHLNKELTDCLHASNLEFTNFISSQTEINKSMLREINAIRSRLDDWNK